MTALLTELMTSITSLSQVHKQPAVPEVAQSTCCSNVAARYPTVLLPGVSFPGQKHLPTFLLQVCRRPRPVMLLVQPAKDMHSLRCKIAVRPVSE